MQHLNWGWNKRLMQYSSNADNVKMVSWAGSLKLFVTHLWSDWLFPNFPIASHLASMERETFCKDLAGWKNHWHEVAVVLFKQDCLWADWSAGICGVVHFYCRCVKGLQRILSLFVLNKVQTQDCCCCWKLLDILSLIVTSFAQKIHLSTKRLLRLKLE